MNCEHLHDFEGLQFMPVRANKQPMIKEWQTLDKKHDLSNCEAVGIVCGELSGGLEVVDVDVKYDLTGRLFEDYKKAIHAADPLLLAKLVVQKTKSGGFHLLYRCSKIAGNQKLANRPTTDEEKAETFRLTYEAELKKSVADDAAKKKAQKAADNDKVCVLLETRGEGGYIVCFPSPGYELIHRDFYGIMEITPEEREILLDTARSFNTYHEEVTYHKTYTSKKQEGLSAFEDYNERGDVIELLQSHGWTVVKGGKGAKINLLRPGNTTSASSGNFDRDKNWFSVFTTSSDFEPQKAYLPYAVFAVLECNKDFSLAAKKLLEMGYGDKKEPAKKESTRVIQSRVNPQSDDYSFLATNEDYDDYLQSVIDGTVVHGLSTHIPSLDKYFLFKYGRDDGGFVMTNGHDNTGKTIVVIYLALLSSIFHGWVWTIFASENKVGALVRKLIQFYWGKPINGPYAMSQEEYRIAKAFVEKHFKFIKAEEEMYNYKDIINMIKMVAKKYPITAAMIDPYNSLKIDLSGFSKLNTHEYHYEALSEFKFFGKKNNIALWINHHAVTAALRLKDAEKKYPVAPHKADTEGGGKVANKADDFLTIHRVTQHPTEWMITDIHVRKVKDTETGGRPTPIDEPVRLEMYNHGCAFREYLFDSTEGNRIGVDPIARYHYKRNGFDKEDAPKQKEAPVISLPKVPSSIKPHWQDTDSWKVIDDIEDF